MPGNFYTPSLEDIQNWPTPDYSNPPEQRLWLGAFAIVWQILSSILVLGRLYLRINKRSGPFGLDDGCIFLAWLFSISLTVTACISDWQYRLGRHVWNFEPQYFGPAAKMGWLAQILFILTMCFTKCSVLLCYSRMAKVTYSSVWMYVVWVLLFITVGSSIGIFVAYFFMCQPLHYYWDFLAMMIHHESGHCINGDSITIATGVLTIASDLWTAAFPCAMFHFHNTVATTRQKVLLNCLFCAGFLVTGVGVARTYYLWEIGHHEDLTWYGYDLYVSSVAEVQLALICICLPFVRSFFRAYFPGLLGTTTHTGTPTPGERPATDWTAIGEEGDDDQKLFYELNEKGMVIPKHASSLPTGEIPDVVEAPPRLDDILPQSPRETLSISTIEISDEAGILGKERSRSRDRRGADHDEDWKRSKVREFVTKRPVKTTSVG